MNARILVLAAAVVLLLGGAVAFLSLRRGGSTSPDQTVVSPLSTTNVFAARSIQLRAPATGADQLSSITLREIPELGSWFATATIDGAERTWPVPASRARGARQLLAEVGRMAATPTTSPTTPTTNDTWAALQRGVVITPSEPEARAVELRFDAVGVGGAARVLERFESRSWERVVDAGVAEALTPAAFAPSSGVGGALPADAEMQEISITHAGRMVRLMARGGRWTMVQPVAHPAQRGAIDRLVASLRPQSALRPAGSGAFPLAVPQSGDASWAEDPLDVVVSAAVATGATLRQQLRLGNPASLDGGATLARVETSSQPTPWPAGPIYVQYPVVREALEAIARQPGLLLRASPSGVASADVGQLVLMVEPASTASDAPAISDVAPLTRDQLTSLEASPTPIALVLTRGLDGAWQATRTDSRSPADATVREAIVALTAEASPPVLASDVAPMGDGASSLRVRIELRTAGGQPLAVLMAVSLDDAVLLQQGPVVYRPDAARAEALRALLNAVPAPATR